MSGQAKGAPSYQADPVGEWIKEATQEFFGQPREPISESTVAKAAIGFLVVAIGMAIIVWQVIGAA